MHALSIEDLGWDFPENALILGVMDVVLISAGPEILPPIT